MLSALSRAPSALARWLGGWSRLALLLLVIVAVVGGLIWQQQRHPSTPPGAGEVATSLMAGIRQTSFRYAGSVDEVRAFYRQTLAESGWEYCGTQATENCTNMVEPNDGSGAEIDVFRRAGDSERSGTTVEVWPQNSENGDTFVTVWETQPR